LGKPVALMEIDKVVFEVSEVVIPDLSFLAFRLLSLLFYFSFYLILPFFWLFKSS